MTVYIDENLAQSDDGVVTCRHCSTALGVASDPLQDALVRESAPSSAGPSVREDASNFTDREIVLRRTFCPECLTQLQSEIVPADEPSGRNRSVKVLGG
jgi:N-methylhydantoinase B